MIGISAIEAFLIAFFALVGIVATGVGVIAAIVWIVTHVRIV